MLNASTYNTLFFVLFFAAGCSKNVFISNNTVYPANDGIEYIGRWDKQNKTRYVSHWGGAYFRLHFTGTSINVTLFNTPSLKIYVDDQPGYKLTGANKVLVNGLQPGNHILVVAANYQSDEIGLEAISLDDTAKIIMPVNKKDVIEFVGNSITAGAGVLTCQAAYPWLVAEQMGFDHTQIAYGGITLVEGYRTLTGPQHGQVEQYFALKEPPGDVDTKFNFTDYTPVMIVIELGANDRGAHVPVDYFEQQYILFLQKIRVKYPGAKIVMLKTSFCGGDYANAQMHEVVNTFNNAGDKKVYFVDISDWVTNADLVDGCHPSITGNKKIADSLNTKLVDILHR
jgi:lysophospholipase L1-like esterase